MFVESSIQPNFMRKICQLIQLSIIILLVSGCSKSTLSLYETVPNDPLNTRIYTLDNGMKVYMSVNKETPRIQTYIAVRVGGKNDPSTNTGLAHYFEHLMFKGTPKFGTQDYEKEKPLLDQIEGLFETYGKTTDDAARKEIYKQIDSLSYEASKFAIPNEYDKLMSAIGANGTNAYTGFDMTVYTEDIPSNQIENWAKIQSERFSNNVIRGFHTELETVYEEKNMSLTRDSRKVYEKLLASLFPNHPYGTQTVLGTQEHLKNPSITKIKEYYKTWYVPNNMAICLSGDFDPDQMIQVIKTYFGTMPKSDSIPTLSLAKEPEITEPVQAEVLGLEAENLVLGWRFPGVAADSTGMLDLIGQIMSNGQAGLIDLNLIQQQKVLRANAGTYAMADYSAFVMMATPKQGQTLEQAKDLLLGEIEKLKTGDFDESLIEASINNLKLYQIYRMESNAGRANWFVNSFINGVDWKNAVTKLDRTSKITKEELVAFAKKNFGNNYAVVYKRQGKDPNELKIAKPAITPIVMNRDTSSAFLEEIKAAKVTPIEPVFLDYSKDMGQFKAKSDIPVLYKQNVTNDLFDILYVYEMGNNNDKLLGTAFQYLKYLGTSKMTPKQIQSEFYKLACSFDVFSSNERVYVALSGLGENMPKALALFEELLADAQVNKEAYTNLAADILKNRSDAKLNQGANFNKLMQYAIWGPVSPDKNIPSASELKQLNPDELIKKIHTMTSFQHRILYYGPMSQEVLTAELNKSHRVPEKLLPVPTGIDFKQQVITEPKVLLAKYDAKQIYMSMVSNRGETFDPAIDPVLSLYNEYFGGSMNAIVFQEMREARGLAYSAGASLNTPSKLKYPYIYQSFIATQNDKMVDALKAFHSIIDDMPQSEKAFNLAKDGLITRLRTERIIKSNVLWNYIQAEDLGLKTDTRKALFEQVQKMTLQDVKAFQEKWIKGRKYIYCILGDEKDLDLKNLESYGPIQRLSQEDIFGY